MRLVHLSPLAWVAYGIVAASFCLFCWWSCNRDRWEAAQQQTRPLHSRDVQVFVICDDHWTCLCDLSDEDQPRYEWMSTADFRKRWPPGSYRYPVIDWRP